MGVKTHKPFFLSIEKFNPTVLPHPWVNPYPPPPILACLYCLQMRVIADKLLMRDDMAGHTNIVYKAVNPAEGVRGRIKLRGKERG